jgi:ABC-type nitrate/sulfonate/bicarbonate transport system substrate-binding protein
MVGPLQQGTIDAAVTPEPVLTFALQNGSRRIAHILHAVCPGNCLITVWLARTGADPNVVARFRNAIQRAAVWANERRNDPASRAVLAKYEFADRTVLAKITRTRFARRLRVVAARPWVDAYIEFGFLPPSFRPIDLVK